MRRWMNVALAGLLAIGMAETVGAATLSFAGTLSLEMEPGQPFGPPWRMTASGAGVALVNGSGGGVHLSSLVLPGGTFGPVTTSIFPTRGTVQSVRFSGVRNLSGSFPGISGGPPGGGTMGLQGLAKICLGFDVTCLYVKVPIPLTPSTGGVGFGIGGTQFVPGAVPVTMQHAPWMLGQPVMTLHTPGTGQSTISAPGAGFAHDWLSNTLIPEGFPDGFVHGPGSATSSAGQPGGVVQLVTVTKAFTSLTGAFPELPVIGVLTLHFVPEPATLLLLGSGAAVLAVYGRRKRGR